MAPYPANTDLSFKFQIFHKGTLVSEKTLAVSDEAVFLQHNADYAVLGYTGKIVEAAVKEAILAIREPKL